jgi:hypothetical protein
MKPGHLSAEAQPARAALASAATGFVPSCRPMIRQLMPSFDPAHSAAHAKRRLQQRSKALPGLADQQRHTIPPGFDAHGEQAWRYLRKKGMGPHRRGANSASGRRRLRRLEKNHDGIRSAATRQHDMQLDQAMTYLSLDIADFIEKGPQLAKLPSV